MVKVWICVKQDDNSLVWKQAIPWICVKNPTTNQLEWKQATPKLCVQNDTSLEWK